VASRADEVASARQVPLRQEFSMPRKAKSGRPTVCERCAGTELVRRIATYPVRLTGQLEGKQINVGRVALHECQTCGHLVPTPAGQAKVARNVDLGIRLFLGQLS
jgi:hypothetical protein